MVRLLAVSQNVTLPPGKMENRPPAGPLALVLIVRPDVPSTTTGRLIWTDKAALRVNRCVLAQVSGETIPIVPALPAVFTVTSELASMPARSPVLSTAFL